MVNYIFTALFLFSPLIIWTTLPYPHAFPRYVWITSVCVAWIIYLVTKHRSIILTRIDAAFFSFIGALGLSTALSIDPWFSLWGSLERSFAFSLWIFLICAYLGLKITWAERKSIEVVGKISICILILMSIWGIAQTAIPGFATTFSGTRIGGTLGNAIFYAMYLSLSVWWVAFLLTTEFFRSSTIWKYAGYASLTIALISFALTRSTGATLGLLAGLGFAATLWTYEKTKHTSILIGAAIATAFIILCGIYAINNNLYQTTTTNIRFIHWKIALQGFVVKPLTGFGYEQYRAAENLFFNPRLTNFSLAETYADKPHNAQLELLVTSGLLGFLTYFAFIALLLFTIWRLKKNKHLTTPQYIILISVLITREIQNFSAFETHGTAIMFVLIISYISHRAEILKETKQISRRKLITTTAACALPLFVFGTVLPFQTIARLDTRSTPEKINTTPFTTDVFTAYSYRIVGEYWQRADLVAKWSPEQKNTWEHNAEELRKLIDNLAAKYNKNAAWQLKLSQSAFQLFSITHKPQDGERAHALLQQTHELTPQRQEPLMLTGQVYLQQNNAALATIKFDSAIALDHKLPAPHWYKGLALLVGNQPQSAWISIHRALELGIDGVTEPVANYIYNKLLTASMQTEAAEFARLINL